MEFSRRSCLWSYKKDKKLNSANATFFGLGQILYLFTLSARDFPSAVCGFC